MRRPSGAWTTPSFTWWHEAFKKIREGRVRYVIDGFKGRPAEATGTLVQSVQVSDGPEKPPDQPTPFSAHDIRGTWSFAVWHRALHRRLVGGVRRCRDPRARSSRLSRVSKMLRAEALPVIERNIEQLLHESGEEHSGDHPEEVFGEYIGRVRTKVARAAVKRLFARGGTRQNCYSPTGQKTRRHGDQASNLVRGISLHVFPFFQQTPHRLWCSPTPLLEEEGNIGITTNISDVPNPLRVHRSMVGSLPATRDHPLDSVQIHPLSVPPE